MENLYREQKKNFAIGQVQARITREKVMTEVIKTQEWRSEMRDINEMEDYKKEVLAKDKLDREIQRRLAMEEHRAFETEKAQEAERLKQEAFKEAKLTQILRDSNPELRELQTKLLVAKVAKEQALQIAHKVALDDIRRHDELEMSKFIAEEVKRNEMEEKAREELAHETKKLYHRALDEQKIAQEVLNHAAIADSLKEREIIDQIVKKIQEEDFEAERKRLQDRFNFQEQIRESIRARDEARRHDNMVRLEEETKSIGFRHAQEYRTMAERLKREELLMSKNKVQRRLLTILEDILEEKLNKEEVRTQLAIYEKEVLEDNKKDIMAEKRAAMAEEAKRYCETQMWLKHQREQMEKKEEELMTRRMMDKLYEEDKVAQMSERKKKEKEMEHRKIIQKMIEDKRSRMLVEREEELAQYRYQLELDAAKDEMVAKERLKILKENANDLLGYLPKGILKNDEELELLGECFQRFYLNKE